MALAIVLASQRRRLDDMVAVSDFVNAIFHHLKFRSRQIACRSFEKTAVSRPTMTGFTSLSRFRGREQPAIVD
jgi:hypothetical protein